MPTNDVDESVAERYDEPRPSSPSPPVVELIDGGVGSHEDDWRKLFDRLDSVLEAASRA